MDDGVDALRLLEKLVDTYSQQPVHFVVVKTSGRGDDFTGFETSACRTKYKATRVL